MRVDIRAETTARAEVLELGGQRLPQYRPSIVRVFPATGVVIDDKSHVLTFLGYRWVDIQGAAVKVAVETRQGERHPGDLIGVDQSLGVALIAAPGARLPRTRFCEKCEVKSGGVVLSPEMGQGPRISSLQLSRILSVRFENDSGGSGEWVVTMNRPVTGIGEPILDDQHRVLGFVADQASSSEAGSAVSAVVYPMSQLMTSAARILKAGGDIRTGWLGVYVDDASPRGDEGILIRQVHAGSPAAKAGLKAHDIVLRWLGRRIGSVREFIRTVQETPIGSRVPIEISRQGNRVTLDAVIESRKPSEPEGRLVFSVPGMAGRLREQGPIRGLSAVPLTNELAEVLSLAGQSGLLVIGVDPGGAFARAGVMAGDVILTIDDRPLRDAHGFADYLRSRAKGARVVLRMFRKGNERSAAVKLP